MMILIFLMTNLSIRLEKNLSDKEINDLRIGGMAANNINTDLLRYVFIECCLTIKSKVLIHCILLKLAKRTRPKQRFT